MTLIPPKLNLTGTIIDLIGDPVITQRLSELGFIPGNEIKLLGTTLFGEPYVVQVGPLTVALRKEEAQCIRL